MQLFVERYILCESCFLLNLPHLQASMACGVMVRAWTLATWSSKV